MNAFQKAVIRSWETTALGIGGILTAVGTALTAAYDSDPTTQVDFNTTLTAIILGLGLIFTRVAYRD